MIFTLTWKELREHQGIWITMVIMTVLMGLGLARLVELEDARVAVSVAALTILGMSAAYGVVCGAMMFAGEHEGGTLVFLDIFLGRRGMLWLGKFVIGLVLVLTQTMAVAMALTLLEQEPPDWVRALLGRRIGNGPNVWYLLLPVVSVEGYAWGLLGSSFTRRVLAGAAVAALGVTPVWLFAVFSPPQVFFILQLVIALIVLAVSFAVFLNQSQEAAGGAPTEVEGPLDRKDHFLEVWEEFQKEKHDADAPATIPPIAKQRRGGEEQAPNRPPLPIGLGPREPESSRKKQKEAKSPYEVLWWLTLEQAWPVIWILAGACFLIGLATPVNAQIIWPLATLLLGVACGTAAFAPEQRDLSYQFLAAQHFPLKLIWRFKTLFWMAVAVAETLVIAFGYYLHLALQNRPGPVGGIQGIDGFQGTLRELMGPALFFGVWLVYGFCAGQVFVWLCRKNVLALLVSSMAGAGVLGLWLPSLLCGGMSGWQLWLPPAIFMLATWFLMRAWAGGRIQERKPLTALIGFGLAVVVWSFGNFGIRAWDVPDIGAPLDPLEFKDTLPVGEANAAAQKIHQAIANLEAKADWREPLAGVADLPAGVVEFPRIDGQLPNKKYLKHCDQMAAELLRQARGNKPGPAFTQLAQVLAVSRNLRNKAPIGGYFAGIHTEANALDGLDQWLTRGKPAPEMLRNVLDTLNRHALDIQPPLDCLHTECYRSGGTLIYPVIWTLAAPGTAERMPERWLTGILAFSLEIPWEAERKTRIWQLVWAGMFRAVDTPYWQLPESADVPSKNSATRKILQCWLPATAGPDARLTHADMARLMDESWLCDERIFCAAAPLREEATRARWRLDATRLDIALSLYQMEEGKPARDLQALVPKYLPTGLPIDPYSGKPYGYRRADAKEPFPGRGLVWSTGPDRIDHGGRKDGSHVATNALWPREDLDLIRMTRQWP